MAAMRLVRPKSLSGLLLIGFALVAVPLLVGYVNATVQMRRLTQQSEALVRHGVEATRRTQELFQHATALERTARLYQVLGDESLKDVFHQHRVAFAVSLAALEKLQPGSATRELTGAVRSDGDQLAQVIDASRGPSAALARAIDEFARIHETLVAVGEKTSADIPADGKPGGMM